MAIFFPKNKTAKKKFASKLCYKNVFKPKKKSLKKKHLTFFRGKFLVFEYSNYVGIYVVFLKNHFTYLCNYFI